jgi:hypothetical protein
MLRSLKRRNWSIEKIVLLRIPKPEPKLTFSGSVIYATVTPCIRLYSFGKML